MFTMNRIRGEISTDTMDVRCKSIHGERYCQVFANKEFNVEAYPITKKRDCHKALQKLARKYGTPDRIKFDKSKKQCEKHTKFQGTLKKYDIQGKVTEPDQSNQNPAKEVIREFRKNGFEPCSNQDVQEDFGIMSFLTLPKSCNLPQVMQETYKVVRQLKN